MSFSELLSPAQVKLGAQLASVALSITSIAFLARGDGRGWPLGVVAAMFFGLVYWLENIQGQAALNVYFLLVQLVGWRRWATGREPDLRRRARRLGRREMALTVLLWLGATPLLAGLLGLGRSLHTGLDAFVTVGSLLGQLLMVAGFAESWLLYLVADVVLVALSAKAELWAYFAMYLVYCALAWQGWRQWTRDGRSERRNEVAQT